MRRLILLALLVPAVARAEVREGWCVIVGSIAYDHFADAAKLAQRARAAGAAGAGVYDPRAFQNLAYGALAVIAVSGLPDSKAAEAAAGPLRKAKLDADVKRCLPAGQPAQPLTDGKKLATEYESPSGPPPEVPAGEVLIETCFAYSAQLGAVACLAGTRDSNHGMRYEVSFLGGKDQPVVIAESERNEEPELKPGKDKARAIEKTLAAGKYSALYGDVRQLDPSGRLDWVIPRFAVEWKRTSSSSEGDLSGMRYTDSILVRCGGRKAEPQEIIGTVQPYAQTASASVMAIPGTKLVVVTLDERWEMEGENGQGSWALLYDLDACSVKASTLGP